MSNINESSLMWLDKLVSLKAYLQKNPSATRDELMKALDLKLPKLKYLLRVSPVFDTEAIEKVRQAAQPADSPKESAHPKLGPQPETSAQGHIFSLNNALALTGLKNRVTDLFGTVHTVLDRSISDRLKTVQIEALVEHLINGKPPQDFDHTQAKRRSTKKTKSSITQPEEDESDEETEDTEESPETPKTSSTVFLWLEELLDGVSIVKPALQKAKKGEPLNGIEWLLLIFHAFLAVVKKGWKFIKPGVLEVLRWYHEISKKAANFIVPHPHSHSSGSKKKGNGSSSSAALNKPLQTLAHWVVYVALQLILLDFILSFVPILKPWLEWPFRWFVHKGLVILPAEAWAYAQDHLVPAVALGVLLALAFGIAFVKKPAQTLVLLAILVLAGYYGRTWSSDLSLPALFSKPTETVSTPVVTPPATIEQPKVEKHLTHASSHSETVEPNPSTSSGRSGQATAFNGDDNEKTLLESAVATFPSDRVIKPIPVTPDSSIGQLMAVNRVGDIAVESEYSLRIGQSGQKIASVTPSATGLTIAIEGGLPLGGLLGGGSALGFYWEDVQTIYTCELDSKEDGKTKPLYYFFLYATNLNQPLVIQCNTTNNLNHLVSAFEYFIKAAQGKYVPVTAMPYLNQGLVLGDENKITALWAGSPADQAGLTFKDHIWAVSGSQPQDKATLEAALQALPSGKQTIEVVTGNDWQAARAKESREHNSKLEPKLTVFELAVP